MKKSSEQLLAKAQDAIEAAELLMAGGKGMIGAGRAYYAMFYAAEALLFESGLEFRKHGGVHAAFGEHFVKTGKIDAKFHRYILDAFESRQEADYGIDMTLDLEAVQEMIQRAKEFLHMSKQYLSKK